MEQHAAFLDQVEKMVSRRTFAKLTGFGGAGMMLSARRADAQVLTDVDILNFALNLEYAEAEFYSVITTGRTIDQLGVPITGVGTPGPSVGAGRLPLTGALRAIAEELANDERQHVLYLRAALGAQAVAKPAMNFAVAGVTNQTSFLTIARILEDVGVSAYGGAAPLISDAATLGAAARIALTEAYHAGNLRLQVAQSGIAATAIDGIDVVNKYFTTDAQGLAKIRTPSQVLALVYLNSTPGTTAGGLFPQGFNGTIRSV
ncbi:MAG: ferritin-like domain-containing protein [Acidobacteria bacterium]|nr:ferritin-like domain-containing protein [Acidobacteriota bacterium]